MVLFDFPASHQNDVKIHAIDCTHLSEESASLSRPNSLHLDRKAGTIIRKHLSIKASRLFSARTARACCKVSWRQERICCYRSAKFDPHFMRNATPGGRVSNYAGISDSLAYFN